MWQNHITLLTALHYINVCVKTLNNVYGAAQTTRDIFSTDLWIPP